MFHTPLVWEKFHRRSLLLLSMHVFYWNSLYCTLVLVLPGQVFFWRPITDFESGIIVLCFSSMTLLSHWRAWLLAHAFRDRVGKDILDALVGWPEHWRPHGGSKWSNSSDAIVELRKWAIICRIMCFRCPMYITFLSPTRGVTFFNSGFKSDPTELFPSLAGEKRFPPPNFNLTP
jgi:hypothetical protein